MRQGMVTVNVEPTPILLSTFPIFLRPRRFIPVSFSFHWFQKGHCEIILVTLSTAFLNIPLYSMIVTLSRMRFKRFLLVKATGFLLLVLDKKPPKIPPNMGRIVSGKVAHSCWPSICPAASTQKSTFPYICIANKGKCFCLAHYEVTIAKDTVNSQ